MVDKKKEKVQKFNPETREAVYSKEKYTSLVTEWEKYHKGTTYDEKTGNVITLEEARVRQRADKSTDLRNILKDKVRGKERDPKTVEKALIDVFKEGYKSRHGIKDEKVVDKKKFEENVKEYITAVANQSTEGRITTFEAAVAEILSAPSPYNPVTENDQSKVLNALYQVASNDSNEDSRRISRLEQSLSDFYFTPYWHERHGDSITKLDIRDQVKNAKPKFKKSATGVDILGTVKELYTTGKVANLNEQHIHYKHKKAA